MVNLIVIAIVISVIVFVIAAYNAFIRLKNLCDNAWSDVDVQLKRRYDLIPNLVNTVKGYASHERGVL
jgi:LemA protein